LLGFFFLQCEIIISIDLVRIFFCFLFISYFAVFCLGGRAVGDFFLNFICVGGVQKIKPKNSEEVVHTVIVEVVQLSQFLFRTKYIDLSPQGIYSET